MKFSLERLAFSGWRYALVALVVALLGGYFFFGRAGNGGATLVITAGDFREEVSVSGTVIAAQDVALGFAANGRIAGTYARVGQHVGPGAVLAETENGDLVAALAQKRSALAEAEANLAELQAGTRPEEIAVTAASVANAEAEVADSVRSAYTSSDDAIHNKADTLFTNPRASDPKLTFGTSDASLRAAIELHRRAMEPVLEKWKTLATTVSDETAATAAEQSQSYLTQVTALLADLNAAINQGIPDAAVTSATLSSYQTTIATARTNVDAAAAALTTDAATLQSAEKNLALKQAGATSENIAAGQAAVAAARSDVESSQAALAKTRIVAPFAGIVTRMDAKTGEIVSPSASEISLQSDGIFEIETFIPEVAIARVAIGNPATTTLDAYGSAVPFRAEVISVDPAETVKDGVPTYKTMLTFLKADPRIRSGMTADVVIETGVLHDAIVIPTGAVGKSASSSYVTVLEGGKNVNRPVETGAAPSLGQIEIISGLSAGDVIVLTPAAP